MRSNPKIRSYCDTYHLKNQQLLIRPQKILLSPNCKMIGKVDNADAERKQHFPKTIIYIFQQ